MGYYSKAKSTENLASTCISSSLNQVTYPLYAKLQDNKGELIRMIKKVAILANGGDVSGFNAVIRAIVKTAENNGIEWYPPVPGGNRPWIRAPASQVPRASSASAS